MSTLQDDMTMEEIMDIMEDTSKNCKNAKETVKKKEQEENGQSALETQPAMQQMERQLTQHLDQYVTLASNLSQEVEDRRTNRTVVEFKQGKRQAFIQRTLWVIFLLLCCVVAYFLYSMQFDIMAY